MNLFRCSNKLFSPKNLQSRFRFSTTTASYLFSAETQDTLYSRVISTTTRDHKISINPILEKWVQEGKPVLKNSLQGIVKQLRKLHRHEHALEVSMWMSDHRYFPLTPGDHAVRLDLLYKVRGLDEAENYFNNIPEQNKVHQTYGALLNCYVEEKSIDKAETLFKGMKQLNRLTAFPYNILMSLYSHTSQHHKMEAVYQEMKDTGIPANAYTQRILLDAYANALNIEKMEVVLKKIEELNALDTYRYAIAARAYMKAGLKDKTLDYIKKAEKVISTKNSRSAWGFLITLYAEIGSKDEMYRIWNANKSAFEKASNSMYMCMISALLKLDDIDGADALYNEWKSQMTTYDIRIPKTLINAYCEKGLLSKVEPLVSEAIGSGEMLSSNTWANLADAYFKVNEIPKAVEMMKKIEVGKTWWKPSNENVNMGLKYFEEKIDVEGAEEFAKLVNKLIPLGREV